MSQLRSSRTRVTGRFWNVVRDFGSVTGHTRRRVDVPHAHVDLKLDGRVAIV
jgi:hypothetical protein